MDPHPIPQQGPWFEGWYSRWTDLETGFSLALITTSYLGSEQSVAKSEYLKGYVSLIIQKPGALKPKVIQAFPEDTRMISHGSEHLRRVDFIEKTDFRWESKSLGYITQDEVNIEIPGVASFRAKVSSGREAWSSFSNNIGPGSFTSFLGFIPLHWHVYSVSASSSYHLDLHDTDDSISGTAILHQEKNWGEVFPSAWMWTQGFNKQGSSFVLAGGQADLGLKTAEAFMGTYRTHQHTINFSPLNTLRVTKEIDSASGNFEIEIETYRHIVQIESSAPVDSFSVLSIPTKEGYIPGAVESFRAMARVKAFRKVLFSSKYRRLISEDVFNNSALEFGAAYWDSGF